MPDTPWRTIAEPGYRATPPTFGRERRSWRWPLGALGVAVLAAALLAGLALLAAMGGAR